ncbi:YdeI/OmpD-associated family protein [Candidatus Poribacteria bacterium]|nr:YdeI/OmpD-associated family protein [Candidatus Poribacteria bacterium]
MTEPGLARIEEAKQSGLWQKSPRADISFEIPEEFERALQQNREAQGFFQQLAPSYQKQYIGWIVVAKRPETREKRIKESIALNDALIDPLKLAKRLNIDVDTVNNAYEELVSEGLVHGETYNLWKDPLTRQCLYDAMKEETTIMSIEELRETLEIE